MKSDPGAMQGDCLTVSGPLRMLHPRLQPSGIVADVGAFTPEEKARVSCTSEGVRALTELFVRVQDGCVRAG